MSKSLRAQLPSRAPDAIARRLGLTLGASWAQCVATALLLAAAGGDVAAAREIRECTEGRTRPFGFVDDGDGDTPGEHPCVNVVFIDSDGNGYPLPAPEANNQTIDAKRN
jgi:hypothetical protein